MLLLSLVIHLWIILSIDAGQRVNVHHPLQKSMLQVTIKHLEPPESHASRMHDEAVLQEPGPMFETMEEQPETSPTIAKVKTKYYTIKELDVVPEPIKPIEPDYPATTPSIIHGGVVRLQLLLDEEGVVTEVTVLSSTPPGYFEDAAREAFINARFTPGIKAGKGVPSLLKLWIRFEVD